MFRAFIVGAAARSCGWKSDGACHSGNLTTCLWTREEIIKLEKEAFQAWLARGFSEAADWYRLAKRATVSAVSDAKTQMWEKF